MENKVKDKACSQKSSEPMPGTSRNNAALYQKHREKLVTDRPGAQLNASTGAISKRFRTPRRGYTASNLSRDPSHEGCSSMISVSLPAPSITSLEQPIMELPLDESSPKLERARRLSYGKEGNKIKLIANFFQMSFENTNIYHYDVDIVPLDVQGDKQSSVKAGKEKGPEATNIEQQKRNVGKERCRQIIFEVIKRNKKMQKYSIVYDGQKNLYSSKELPIKKFAEFEISIPDNNKEKGYKVDDKDKRIEVSNKNKRFRVIIKPVNKKDTGDNVISLKLLPDYIAGKVVKVPEEIRMVFETILSHRNPPYDQVVIGRSFFFKDTKKDPLGGGGEVWRGYNQSVRFTEKGPAVVINLAAAAFHKSGPVMDYASEILEKPIHKHPLKPNDINTLSNALSKVIVQVTHLKYPRKYPVKGLTNLSAKELKFTLDGDGGKKEMSVEQYFCKKYSIKLEFPDLPCLHMRTTKNEVFVPMEVCVIPAGQRMLSLEGPQTAQMIRKTAICPDKRFDSINQYAQTVSKISDPYLRSFDLTMSLNPMHLTGRVLNRPAVKYFGSDNNSKITPNARGVWDMRKQTFQSVASVQKWWIVSFVDSKRCKIETLQSFAELLCNTGPTAGFRIKQPDIFFCKYQKPKCVVQSASKNNVNLLVVVLSKQEDCRIYDEIKYFADVKYNLVTQCLDVKSVNESQRNKRQQVASNVCLKINLKLGGINHTMAEKHKFLRENRVLILGADVVHGINLSCISIAAVVGCIDTELSKYAVCCRAQKNLVSSRKAQEIILDLKEMVLSVLRSFLKNTRTKPNAILFYRDGVSEGQFQHVLEQEIPMIKDACKSLEKDYQPPITFTIVQKRHQIRLRPENPRDWVGTRGNVPPGTTVDTDIVDPFNFDFYLCSHEGIQGTSRPAHYTVLFNENRLNADAMQSLSYYLCHVYARCNRSISIPAPVKYADLLAYRVKSYIDGYLCKSSSQSDYEMVPEEIKKLVDSIEKIQNKMFFL